GRVLGRDRSISRAGSAAVTVAIVDYGSGNLHSAAKAFERAAPEGGARQPNGGEKDPQAVGRRAPAGRPGGRGLSGVRGGAGAGVGEGLEQRVRGQARPFLGICVGMQLMAERGREYVVTPGLGWIAGEVDRIAPADPDLKIPHMGWNTLNPCKPHALLEGIAV